MTKYTNTLTRRSFLKGTAYLSALSAGGLSSLAIAGEGVSGAEEVSQSPLQSGGIKIIQETMFDREKVTLINQSGKLQMLDARQPVSLHKVDGQLVVSVNQDEKKAVNGMLAMSPDQHLTFDVKAMGIEVNNHTNLPLLTGLAEKELQISSTHSIFNRVVPVQVV